MKSIRYALRIFSLACFVAISQQALAINIFTCEPEWHALATEIAGSEANVYVATSANQDPHHVQARPSLISAVRRADLVFCTGGGLESGWLPVLLSKGSNPKVQRAPGLLLAAEQVALLEKPVLLDRAEGDIHASGNPHVHLDPRRILIIAEKLKDRLIEIDAKDANGYQKRFDAFHQRWQKNIQHWEQQAAPLRNTPVIVHHRSWSYLLDWLGIRQVGELEPKPGIPPTPAHLASLISTTQTEHAQLILFTRYNGDKAAKWLTQRSDACAVELPFTVGGDDDSASLDELFSRLIDALVTTQTNCKKSGAHD
ncbi:MAG: zinc ABC transporter substrate-binding protein [Alcanivoracaceae bacterium]|nr:zinc ABC transporter substrate-binding protein [Alcanivoracaceae bacterium]